MTRRASSHDVAKLAGVSQSSVSLVLSKRTDARISDSTRQRIIAAAAELNYHAHSSAKALATGRTHRLGIVPNKPDHFGIHDTYYYNIMVGMMQGASQESYNLLLHAASYHDWHSLHQDIMSGAADGVLLVGRGSEDSLTEALLDSHFPTVCISYDPGRADSYVVDCENEQGGALAVQHLLNLGHRSILILYITGANSWMQERDQGAARAVAEAALPPETLITRDMACFGNWEAGWVKRLALAIREFKNRPTAIICFDEILAQELTELLPENGFRLPEDLALVSFNSTDISVRSNPPMTSVYQPLISIGECAVHMLVDILEDRTVEQKIMRFPMRLDIRESCGSKRD